MSPWLLLGAGLLLGYLFFGRRSRVVYSPPPTMGWGGAPARRVKVAPLVVGIVVVAGVLLGAASEAGKASAGGEQRRRGSAPTLGSIFEALPRPSFGNVEPSKARVKAVRYALAQRGKPYVWGAKGPHAYDCSGLMWRAWRAAGVSIPRTAEAQRRGLPRVRGKLKAGDLVIYRTGGRSRRHVAMVVAKGLMVEAPRRGVPVRMTRLRGGWIGAVRPGGR